MMDTSVKRRSCSLAMNCISDSTEKPAEEKSVAEMARGEKARYPDWESLDGIPDPRRVIKLKTQ